MTISTYEIISIGLVLLVAVNIKLISSPRTAVLGNRLSTLAMAAAIIVVMLHEQIIGIPLLLAAVACGSIVGLFLGAKPSTLQVPQLVALFNGFGGGASLLVSLVLLVEAPGALALPASMASMLAIVVGGVTLSGSLVAAGKLHSVIAQRPVQLKGHAVFSLLLLLAMVSILIATPFAEPAIITLLAATLVGISLLYGILFTIRIGGADMPVTISLLNSLSGIAASICGFAVKEILLVAIGAVVGAAGLILTMIMLRGMNRSLVDILTGKTTVSSSPSSSRPATSSPVRTRDASENRDIDVSKLMNAGRVIMVPGYGMALAQAQWQVKSLYDELERRGVDVKFAIHPVAGRMPGHMNVLLAEVEIPYDRLYDLKEINHEFSETDVVVVVGACDVVNPAANTASGTPIYGMPVLHVQEAGHVIVCNRDDRPGYSGVENSLYEHSNVTLVTDDAAATLGNILRKMRTQGSSEIRDEEFVKRLAAAGRVVMVPGYGMALAQAQWQVKSLYDELNQRGVDVKFAIHPVAGRMPGHMNVLLAEVEIPYDRLYDLKEINHEFSETDVVVVVGACDVVNPAANTASGTPIYGMPVLHVQEAGHVIVCNRDDRPGYSGVENSLYEHSNVTLVTGDAADSLNAIISALQQTELPYSHTA